MRGSRYPITRHKLDADFIRAWRICNLAFLIPPSIPYEVTSIQYVKFKPIDCKDGLINRRAEDVDLSHYKLQPRYIGDIGLRHCHRFGRRRALESVSLG